MAAAARRPFPACRRQKNRRVGHVTACFSFIVLLLDRVPVPAHGRDDSRAGLLRPGVTGDAAAAGVRWRWRRLLDHAGLGGYYHRRLLDIYRAHVPAGQRVLELGCGTGDVLAAVQPAHGLGVDLSPAIVAAARARHSQLAFEVGDAHDLSSIEGPFDVVILSDLLNDLWDVQAVFGQVARLSHPGTRLIVNNYSRLWELPLAAANGCGWPGRDCSRTG